MAERGGYRPGAGRPRTRLVARTGSADAMAVLRAAASMGLTAEELAGYLISSAIEARLMPLTAAEVRRWAERSMGKHDTQEGY